MTAPVTHRTVDVDTPLGPARATVSRPTHAVGTLVLGHGAGGSGWSADLLAVRDAAVDLGWAVALVDQPWRLQGKRVAPAPARLDQAWLPVVRTLRGVGVGGGRGGVRLPGPLVLGGRSAGARVACRTAHALAADGVLCLAFPLHPPGRPASSRADELARGASDGRPVLVVQGERDPFGDPAEVRALASSGVTVVAVAGDHGLRADAGAVASAAATLLAQIASATE